MIVLASNSPRRKQLMALGGWNFQVIPAEVDESLLPGEAPRDYVLRLAREKVAAATLKSPPGSLIVSADTTVVYKEQILGKPSSPAEAVEILRQLRGRLHLVLTGVAVLRQADMHMLAQVCQTDVFMRAYSDAEIRDYVQTGDPMDKAGAYAIQHAGFSPVERIHGCYANVVGLPLCTVTTLLRQLGMEPPNNITDQCDPTREGQCQVSSYALEVGL